MRRVAIGLVCMLALAGAARAQGRDWMTDSADAQRSAWIRSDTKINPDSMAKPGFQFLWKMKLKNPPRQLNNLQPPATLERLIGYRGFRMLGFVAGSSDNIFTIDTDLGRMEWERHFNSSAPAEAGTIACPGGLTNGVARPALTTIPPAPNRYAGGGRSTPAKSDAGKPGQGAVTLANVRPSGPGFDVSQMMPQRNRVNASNPPGGQFGAGPFLIHALAGDGMLYSMHLSNGADYQPPLKFLPPNANSRGLIVLDNLAYVVTDGGCGGAPNGVWSVDTLTKEVKTFKANIAGTAGMAFGADGTLYVATGSGGDHPNSLLALDPQTLSLKASFSAGAQAFTSTPLVFTHQGKTLIAAATADGRIHLFDSANLKAPLASSAATVKAGDFAPGALASWQDIGGTRWILAPATGTQAAELGFKTGPAAKGAVVAWKIAGDSPAPQPAWASRSLVSPLTPTIISGVVFITSSGEFRTSDSRMTAAQRAARSRPAVVYALDGTTGKELWSSGAAITSFARGGALSGGMGQIYLTTYDGTIYAFGYPMEH